VSALVVTVICLPNLKLQLCQRYDAGGEGFGLGLGGWGWGTAGGGDGCGNRVRSRCLRQGLPFEKPGYVPIVSTLFSLNPGLK